MEERNYGIDLLRLVLMYMICVLHVLGCGGVLSNLSPGTPKYAVYWLFEIISYGAVDTFALISGYMAKNRRQKYDKIANMWFQAFFYSFILTLVFKISGIADISLKTLIKSAFPVTFQSFWYFTAYFGLFFVMPALNHFIFSISEDRAKKALIVLAIIFSGLSTINDPFQTQYGYSMLWLVLLYTAGALAKRIHLFETRKTSTLFLWMTACVLINLAILLATGIKRQINYVSPTVLCCSLILLVLFSRIKLSSRLTGVVRLTSKLAFGIYLFQLNYVIWNQVLNDRFADLAEVNVIQGILSALLAASVLFLAGLLVEAVRFYLHQKLGIPRLCDIIVSKARIIVSRLAAYVR